MHRYDVRILLAGIFLATTSLCGCTDKPYSVKGDTVTVHVAEAAPGGARTVRLQFAGPELVRVSASPDGRMHDRKSLVVVPQASFRDFHVSEQAGEVWVQTAALTAAV